MPVAPVSFVVPGKPKGKQRPRATRQGRVYTPAETRNFEAFVKLLAAEAVGDQGPFEGPVELHIEVGAPIPVSFTKKQKADALAKRLLPVKSGFDLDNIVKALSDAMNGIVFVDDKQVALLVATKHYAETPGTAVFVAPVAI